MDRMRVVAAGEREDGSRWCVREDGVWFTWSDAQRGWRATSYGGGKPVPGCAMPDRPQATAPSDVEFTAQEKSDIMHALTRGGGGAAQERMDSLAEKLDSAGWT